MPRTATIGPAVYKRVNELVGEGKNRTEAFQVVASERSMNQGTVAANYYRTARGQGSTGRPKTRARKASATRKATTRTPGSQARGRVSAPTTADGDLTALASQIGDLVQQLVQQVEERDRRLREVLG